MIAIRRAEIRTDLQILDAARPCLQGLQRDSDYFTERCSGGLLAHHVDSGTIRCCGNRDHERDAAFLAADQTRTYNDTNTSGFPLPRKMITFRLHVAACVASEKSSNIN
ncbi:MAG: hypothetical protein CMM26_07090 [Rhodospirillaceae bacterium]|nr:hypothetical protein [Rhodospirillaceae bacterium]|tara:strand:- start:548 stop:874 length:327 start_codon:yes stop_codon:yes gene_type:complete